MIYVLSDIHGDYISWRKMLELIDFRENDEMYVLGDTLDRGENPIDILREMKQMPNLTMLMGNHEMMFYNAVSGLPTNCTSDNFKLFLDDTILADFSFWISEGGKTTWEQFVCLDEVSRKEILDYIGALPLYDQFYVNGKRFVVTHSGITDFSAEIPLEQYSSDCFLYDRPTKLSKYYSDRMLIFGHTPTMTLSTENSNTIIKTDSWIDIDSGCGFRECGGCLSCLRLDDYEEFYV